MRGWVLLGDFLGSLASMGACAVCRVQFMSRRERVHVSGAAGSPVVKCAGCSR